MKPLISNPSSHTLYMREYRNKNILKIQEYNKNYYQKLSKNPDWVQDNRERSRSWGRENATKVIEKVRLWSENNPERARELGRRSAATYRARLKNLEIGDIDYVLVHERSNNKCGICNYDIKDDYDYDHIIPVTKNGSHTTNNLQLSHPICNRAKGNRLDYQAPTKIIMASLSRSSIYKTQKVVK